MTAKPPFRSPCNHCGMCCQAQLCEVGEMVFPGAPAPCPGLLKRDDRHLCGLVLMEQAARALPLIQFGLGIGTGCSMPDDTTLPEEIARFDVLSLVRVHELYQEAK